MAAKDVLFGDPARNRMLRGENDEQPLPLLKWWHETKTHNVELTGAKPVGGASGSAQG